MFTDEEWRAFCQVIGEPEWTKEQKFATLDLRKENEDELEALVAEWTKEHTAEDVMQMMQAGGVSAGVVQNAQDILECDPQIRERGFSYSPETSSTWNLLPSGSSFQITED